MKYRRRRRRSSYGRRKSSDVIVLSDTEELKKDATKETEDKPLNEETIVESEEGTTGMDVQKDDPIHEPDDEESPVVVPSSDPQEVFNGDTKTSNATLNKTNVQESCEDEHNGKDEQSEVTRRWVVSISCMSLKLTARSSQEKLPGRHISLWQFFESLVLCSRKFCQTLHLTKRIIFCDFFSAEKRRIKHLI